MALRLAPVGRDWLSDPGHRIGRAVLACHDRLLYADGEGLVCKSTGPNSVYQAGARGWQWIKLKRATASRLRSNHRAGQPEPDHAESPETT